MPQCPVCSACGKKAESQLKKLARDGCCFNLVIVVDTDEHIAVFGQTLPGRKLGFREGRPETGIHAHDFACGAHLRSKIGRYVRKFHEWKNRGFYSDHLLTRSFLYSHFLQRSACGDFGRDLRPCSSRCLADEGHRSRSPWIYFKNVYDPVPQRELKVDQSFDFQALRQPEGLVYNRAVIILTQHVGGKHTAGISGMDTRLLDMLHKSADKGLLPVADGIHIELESVLKKPVHKNGVVRRNHCRFPYESLPGFLVIDDFHGAPAQHIGGTHEYGVSDLSSNRPCLFKCEYRTAFGLLDIRISDQFSEPLSVFRQIDKFRRSTEYGHSRLFQPFGQFQRSLTPKLDDNAVRFFRITNIKYA